MYSIPLDRAYLIALWLETYLFGAYTVVFMTSLYLLFWRRPSGVSWTLIIPLIILYILATTHVTIVLIRNIQGFVGRGNQVLGGARDYFLEASSPLNVANQAIYATNNLVGDSVLIWRCWVVWGRSFKVILVPCLLWLGTAVTGYQAAYHFHLSVRGIFNHGLEVWAKAFFCCTLATNLLVTSLIAGRIWSHGRRINRSVGSLPSMGKSYWAVLAIVIESGALYSSALVIEIALYVTKTNAIYVIFDGMAQVIGLVPTMIVVLVGMGMARGNTSAGTGGTGTTDSIRFNTRRTGVSDVTTADSRVYNIHNNAAARHRGIGGAGGGGGGGSRHHPYHHSTQPDVDLDNLPTARAISLPGGEDWPSGKHNQSLDMSFGAASERDAEGEEDKEKGRLSVDTRDPLPPPPSSRRAGGSASALNEMV